MFYFICILIERNFLYCPDVYEIINRIICNNKIKINGKIIAYFTLSCTASCIDLQKYQYVRQKTGYIVYNTCSADVDCCLFLFQHKTHTNIVTVTPIKQITAADTVIYRNKCSAVQGKVCDKKFCSYQIKLK